MCEDNTPTHMSNKRARDGAAVAGEYGIKSHVE